MNSAYPGRGAANDNQVNLDSRRLLADRHHQRDGTPEVRASEVKAS
jgi:hypothetical protein